MTDTSCFICGGDYGRSRTRQYRRCLSCGHETLAESDSQGFIINDPLSIENVKRMTALDRFKRDVFVRYAGSRRGTLVDVGSSTGRFLYQNSDCYRQGYGLEVTPQAVEFSRNFLRLKVVESSDQLPTEIDVVTAWHSLEHIPPNALIQVLQNLAARMQIGGCFIVSVPNVSSKQYQWFRDRYAYFDVPNHLHQFSNQSLDLLMDRFGFKRISSVTSWPYNVFGYVQGLLNVMTRSHNYLYYRIKRRTGDRSWRLDVLSAAFLPLAIPAGWLLSAMDLFRSNGQGVITACFEKRI